MTMRGGDETLRLQFGAAANAVGTQLRVLEEANGGNNGLQRSDGTPRVLAFEAKGRIHRKVSATKAVNRDEMQDSSHSWSGGVQVYDQAPETPSQTSLPSSALWNWDLFSNKNLIEIEEFRPYMPLHNVYEGQPTSRDGSIAMGTIDAIEDRLRAVLEECDNLRFIQNIVDMDSSWAGLSIEVLTYLVDECPSAVLVTFGNDWSYPLSDQSDANLYAAGIESRDRSKIEARRGMNLITSVASFIEHSSVFIPVAMSSATRRYTLHGTMPEIAGAAAFAATSIEIAMSEFRSTPCASVYSLTEGILPSMKVLELAARCPLIENPSLLLNETTWMSEPETRQWSEHSLLPRHATHRATAFSSSLAPPATAPPRFRRVHFVGAFDAHASSLRTSLERFQPQYCVAHWRPGPLLVPTSALSPALVDAASQLALSSAVGSWLQLIATQSSRSDKRVLYEFTQAGMNVDAVEELQTTLRAVGDAYPKPPQVEAPRWEDEDLDLDDD